MPRLGSRLLALPCLLYANPSQSTDLQDTCTWTLDVTDVDQMVRRAARKCNSPSGCYRAAAHAAWSVALNAQSPLPCPGPADNGAHPHGRDARCSRPEHSLKGDRVPELDTPAGWLEMTATPALSQLPTCARAVDVNGLRICCAQCSAPPTPCHAGRA